MSRITPPESREDRHLPTRRTRAQRRLHLMLDESLANKLIETANAERRPVSEQVNLILEQHFDLTER